jgi:hypothetical protein
MKGKTVSTDQFASKQKYHTTKPKETSSILNSALHYSSSLFLLPISSKMEAGKDLSYKIDPTQGNHLSRRYFFIFALFPEQ